ncbi:MAG: toll/interleukin-1 receptor domain-containing protein [bacterium]|nr:toll/interleukin-1 receptor domain-containing protein [bacterium]MDI1336273.1 toll/interleukin-1 receptor domain-containing protein [Lacunisphaera sp.]
MSLPRPTLFISYASEDRPAVLLLRNALEAAGLDVWYDANELGGGDAWDQKIRRQIRDCDYFMPVISATTERRKEGYFRREWRLAAERTMDMADDVMFLIPAVLDDTSEVGARVPEKFLTVQWLRVPGGQPTPALEAVAARIATGDHSVPPPLDRPPPVNRPRVATTAPFGKPEADGPPPMPPFPHLGDNHNLGHRVKFFAEVIWWALAAGWLLFKRAPRWLRIIITIWFVIWGFSVAQCNRSQPTPAGPPKVSASDKAEARKALRATAEKFAQFGNKPGEKPGDKPGALAEIARSIAAELKDADNSDKKIVVVPFNLGVTNEADAKFLGDVFTPLYGRLAVAHPGETGLSTKLPPPLTDEALIALGQKLDAGYVLGAHLTTENGASTLILLLVKVEDASIAWTARYPVAASDPTTVAEQIATSVLAAVAAK